MAEHRHGEIWWANLPQPAGRRPVVILTRPDVLPHLTSVTIAPLTRSIRHVKSEVVLTPSHGVPNLCAVTLDNINTVSTKLLDRKIATLDRETMLELYAATRFALAMA